MGDVSAMPDCGSSVERGPDMLATAASSLVLEGLCA